MPTLKKIIEEANIIDLPECSKAEALEILADTLAKRPEVTNRDDLLVNIVNREKVISTGIGIGLAMPHVKIPSVTDFVLAIGRSTRGIEFDALDGHPVHIVAMICASDKQARDFLKILAQLILKLKDKSLRQKVLLKPTPEAVKAALLSDPE